MLILQVPPLPSCCVCNRRRAGCLLSLYSILFHIWMLFPCLYPPSSQNLSNLSSVLVNPVFQSCGHSGHCPLDSLQSVLCSSGIAVLQWLDPPAEVLLEQVETMNFPVCNLQAVLLFMLLTVVRVISATAWPRWLILNLWSAVILRLFFPPEEVLHNQLSSFLYLQSLDIPAEL